MAKRTSDFGGMSVSELVEMRDQIDHLLRGKVAKERNELQARLDVLSGFEIGSERGRRGKGRGAKRISGANGSRQHPLKGRKAAIKYRGPAGETWSGRGLAPRWLAALEAKGKKRTSYLV